MPNQADLIDRDLLRRRRVELCLTERDLAKRIGLSGVAIGRLERDRAAANDFPLSTLRRLADALAVHPSELIAKPPDAEPKSTADAASVGRLIVETDAFTPIGVLVETLHWSRNRVRAALNELADLAPLVGMRLAQANNRVGLVAGNDATPDDLKVLVRKHYARAGMKVGEARVLHRVMTGDLDVAKLGNADRVALARLANAGLVEVVGATAQLAPDAKLSLSRGAS